MKLFLCLIPDGFCSIDQTKNIYMKEYINKLNNINND